MATPVNLVINGEMRALDNARTVIELLTVLELTGRLAVEVNGEIVPRSGYADYQLQHNDSIEIVRAIGGG